MKKSFLLVFILMLAMALTMTACTNDEGGPVEDDNMVEEANWWEKMDIDWQEASVALDTGINMTYMVCGPEDGTPIVLLHGATDSRLSWAQVAPTLAQQYRVYVPELRGHGKTDKPEAEFYTVADHTADVAAFMDAVGLTSANIAGHSLGSFIAQQLAITVPEKVTSITLIASGAVTTGNATLDWVYNGDGEAYLGVNAYDAEGALPESFIAEWTACTNEDAAFCEAIAMHAAALPYECWSRIFGGIMEYDATADLASITCPVQIVYGTADVIFTADDQQALQDALTGAETVEYKAIEGASHNTHWDSISIADQVTALIANFAK